MAPQDASAILNELRPALQAAAKNVLRHAYGPDGMPWGTRLGDLEELAVQVGQLLSREVLHSALQRQAQTPPPQHLQPCPCCGGPLDHNGPHQREVQTDVGVVTWDEPAARCPRCRRAFSPSVQGPGH